MEIKNDTTCSHDVPYLLLCGDCDVNSRNKDGETTLDIAIKDEYHEVVELLRSAESH